MPLLFSLTLFCSALLLFQVQPMVGKMLLPKLGGTPAVWNTCMVFFQAALLAGYAYAHALSRWGGNRGSLLHIVVLLSPLLVLPIAIGDAAFRSAAASESPVLVVLGQLTLAVGLPFFVVSTTAPLLQRWFANTGHPSAHDPYFLYAASNAGSMLALLAYPLVVEPLLPLDQQCWYWMWGYVLFAALVSVCAAAMWRTQPQSAEGPDTEPTTAPRSPLHIPRSRAARWVFLAFVPSSFLLGCTTYISLDLAPIPLLWVIPLALYLLTFIVVFAKRPPIPHSLACRLLPMVVLVLALVFLTNANQLAGVPVWVLLGIHLAAFFLTALVAHGELAQDRPSADHLTEFFLWISIGGVLGGTFNALLAPIIFQHTGLTEYPLAVVLACFVRPRANREGESASPINWKDVVLPLAAGLLAIGLFLLAKVREVEPGAIQNALVFGIPCLLVFTFAERVPRFGLGIGAMLLAGWVNVADRPLVFERNFFGVVSVFDVQSEDGVRFRQLRHGNTLHGQMRLDALDAEGRHEPLTYYHRTGPVGVTCEAGLKGRPNATVGVVGLGTGSLAYYARPGDHWIYYEIDPTIERVAKDPRYFAFLSESRASSSRVVLGDAYLRLQEEPEAAFDLLILDAFSSDSIPVHLMTREAIALYRSRLKRGGVLAYHISNRYLNLRPIVAKLAEDGGLVARDWRDDATDEANKLGKTSSEWVILAERDEDFGAIVWPRGAGGEPDPRWKRIEPKPGTPLWTNNFSNLLSAMMN